MRKITLDAETRSKLSPGAEEIEICDERGTTLGYFVPPDEYRERFYAWAISLFDDDEPLISTRVQRFFVGIGAII